MRVMQAVILAAGRGKRMADLTKEVPKPLLKFNGQTLIEQKLAILPPEITEILIVVGYLKDKIIAEIGNSYRNTPIRYVVQNEALGTAHALWCCREFLYEKFIVLMSDDIYDQSDISEICQAKEWAVLIFPSDEKINAGKCLIDEQKNLIDIVEDFNGSIPYNYIYTGVCILDPEIFSIEMTKLSNGEYGLPQTFIKLAREKKIQTFFTKNWKRITAPQDLH